MLNELLTRFTEHAPVATMVQATLANTLSDAELDALFRETALEQREGELLFSSVVSLLHMAVLKTKPSLHAAYKARHQELSVSVKSVYDKLAGTELRVTRELVRRTASKMRAIVDALAPEKRELLPGYEVRVLDGSHLRATERRLDVQRMINGAPLPGQALVVLDPQRMLVEDMFPCECGHTQERLILQQTIETLQPGIVWIADRNFCTSLWLQEVDINKSWFINRLHASFPIEYVDDLREVGTTATGTVYERQVTHTDRHGASLKLRLISLELNEKTGDGDTRIELLTNLPEELSATAIAEAYRGRWTIEGVFGELTLSLNGEIDTLAYPPAAILAYALALVSYNVLTIVRSAVSVVHGAEAANEMSTYYMAEEVGSVSVGMNIVIPLADWRKEFGQLPSDRMADRLKQMAQKVNLRKYRKHRRGPKKPQPQRTGSYQHVSTQKLIDRGKR